MKKCAYCNDPILKFQEHVTVSNEKPLKSYHKGCYKLMDKESQCDNR